MLFFFDILHFNLLILISLTKRISKSMQMNAVEDDILTDVAVQLLIIEGIPLLGLVYYLWHKRKMYLMEKGVQEKDDPKARYERRLINGVFLTLAGIIMILTPRVASAVGIEAQLTFELLLASMVVLCAGIALLAANGMLRYREGHHYEKSGLRE
jgi:hypothetical protein